MKSHKKLFYAAGIMLMLTSSTLFAAEQSARDILNKAYQYIGNMDSYTFDAVVTEERTNNDNSKTKIRKEVSVNIVRPGSFRVDTKGNIQNRSFYLYDGMFTMIDHNFGYYAEIKTPKTIDGALDFIFEKYGINAPVGSLMYSDMHKRTKFRKSKNFGTMIVDNTECNYIAFGNKDIEIHAWIATGDKPLVKTYSIINKTGQETSRRNTSFRWNTNAKISENDFVFTAPENAAKISVEPVN